VRRIALVFALAAFAAGLAGSAFAAYPQTWWSGPGGMEPYSVCYHKKGHKLHIDDTTAHRNHIHIGLRGSS
jgi:hypothetical protein